MPLGVVDDENVRLVLVVVDLDPYQTEHKTKG